MLRQNNYAVEEIEDLTGERGIPPSCRLLVVMGPRERFAAEEIAKIRAYLQDGGRVMVMVNPGSDGGMGRLLKEYGIISPDNQAVQYNRQGQLDANVFLGLPAPNWQQREQPHPIVMGCQQGAQGQGRREFIVAKSVREVSKDAENRVEGYLVTNLLDVPKGYVGSEDTSANPKTVEGPRRGPYPFAVIAEKLKDSAEGEEEEKDKEKPGIWDVDQEGSKLLVIGDSDLFSDAEIVQGQDLRGSPVKLPLLTLGGANDVLAMVAVGYMAGVPAEMPEIKKEQPKVYVSDEMKKMYEDTRKLTGLVLWLGLPGALLLLGLGVWIARRSY